MVLFVHHCWHLIVPLLPSLHAEKTMKIANSDRRLSRRLTFKTPLRVRIWKSAGPEAHEESVNLSHNGVFFATNSPIREGETVEILLNMPEEVTAEPTTEWRCTGHVVRVERVNSPRGNLGIGVQFDCYEVSRGEMGPRKDIP
jgi:hypothetical protein